MIKRLLDFLLSFMGLIDEEYCLTSKGEYALRLYRAKNKDAYYRYITRQFLLAKGIRKILKSHTKANKESSKKKFKLKEYNTYIFRNNKELFVGKENYKNYSRYLSNIRSTCKGLKLGTPSSNPYQFELDQEKLQDLLNKDYQIE